MKRLVLMALLSLSAGTLASGCLVSGSVRTRAYVAQPDLVYVSPGVYVVADYDEPVFYSDNYYWLYRGGVWYRSSYYNGGWISVRTVPNVILRVDRPHTYVRVHGDARTRVRNHRGNDRRRPAPRERVRVRDHRR